MHTTRIQQGKEQKAPALLLPHLYRKIKLSSSNTTPSMLDSAALLGDLVLFQCENSNNQRPQGEQPTKNPVAAE
uniref:Uncharacterized protein n=1 Tax=Physcomitrium patens TaxID=3218 RepID=A0A2K1KCY5_PHYPA|nr:hypothetical protein PHYPA_010829 [Physcomitrium patens]